MLLSVKCLSSNYYSSDKRVAGLLCLCLWLGSVLAAAAALAARAKAVLSVTAG
jgi:hypothetical protein